MVRGGLGGLPEEGASDPGRVEVELVEEERIGAHRDHLMRLQRRAREVPEVKGHQDLGTACHGGGEDVTVLAIARHRIDQRLVVGDSGGRERGPHVQDPPRYSLGLQAGLAFQNDL